MGSPIPLFREREMAYTDIDSCDVCGADLEDGRWLVGLCKRCETARVIVYGTKEIVGGGGVGNTLLPARPDEYNADLG